MTYYVYLGKFAFNNPNLPCWYVEASEPYLIGIDPAVKIAEGSMAPVDYTDVHGNFHTWFQYMFWLQVQIMLVTIGYFFLEYKYVKGGAQTLRACYPYFCGIITAILYLNMWVRGLLWRFDVSGTFACGDDLANTAIAGPLV